MVPLCALLAVVALAATAYLAAGVAALRPLLAIGVPAAAALLFLVGLVRRVLGWSNSPVPFRIPLTAGQQSSFAWLKPARFDNPSTTTRTVVRMGLEVLAFRSLLRNVVTERREGTRLVFREAVGLWLAALVFHYSLLVILVRHLRFFLQPVPSAITSLAAVDSFFQVGVPPLYLTDIVLFAALVFLLIRRFTNVALRYLSLPIDYALLLLLLAIATTGVLMRHVVRVDTIAVKELALGMATLSRPAVSASLHPLVFSHIVLVSTLVALLPFSKLMHMAGLFLSPTRNLANNSRAKRHVNPWNRPADVHAYHAWENEFRDKMIAAGVPTDTRPAESGGSHG